jgi:TonB family protein
MKTNFLIVTTLAIVLTGCSFLFSGPSATVKKFMAAAEKGDSETMTKLFSSKAIEKIGIDTIKKNNQSFAETSKRARDTGGTYSMNQLKEVRTGDTARVSFFYQNDKKTDSVKMVFALIKEGGEWKIDDIGGAEKDEAGGVNVPTPSDSTVVPPPPPPPDASSGYRKGEPISGGILNGKATSLPKPPYPPAARAVKAAGVVTVQVTVDEKGSVTSATAVSGHPLLRQAAVSAAYGAKFPPTRLSGQPVKVKGVITYTFVAE